MSDKKVYLVTGATGFVGWHMLDYLLGLDEDVEIHATYRYRSPRTLSKALLNFLPNFLASEIAAGHVNWHECDFYDASGVHSLFQEIKPTRVIHLAAMSFVPQSFDAPQATLVKNTIMQVNVLEAARAIWDDGNGVECRVHCCGSSEEYGNVESNEVPITEFNHLRPLSPYGISKVAQDLLGYQYHQSYGLFTVRTRAFNHFGPGRGKDFAESAFSIRALEAYNSPDKTIRVGNLEAIRDYTDVRDIVRAYVALLDAPSEDVCGKVFNICSGVGHTMREVLETICIAVSKGSMEKWWKEQIDERYIRPSDVPLLLGDNMRIYDTIGWFPEIEWRTTIQDLVEYWAIEKGYGR